MVLILAGNGARAWAQTADPDDCLSTERILRRYVDALGGQAALSAVDTRTSEAEALEPKVKLDLQFGPVSHRLFLARLRVVRRRAKAKQRLRLKPKPKPSRELRVRNRQQQRVPRKLQQRAMLAAAVAAPRKSRSLLLLLPRPKRSAKLGAVEQRQ